MTNDTSTAKRRSSSRGMKVFIRDILLIILAALVISFVIKTFFFRSFYIPSGSMENTLQLQDRVIVSLLTPGLTPLKRGDVVVFTDPSDWLGSDPTATPSAGPSPVTDVLSFLGLVAPDADNHLIKRVIGLAGDEVKCCSAEGKLEVNGVQITEPYIDITGYTNADPYSFDITVPKGDIWVLGDNRYQSADSAYHYHEKDETPFVPIKDITGRAVLISWPASRWTILGNYPDVFADVEKRSSK